MTIATHHIETMPVPNRHAVVIASASNAGGSKSWSAGKCTQRVFDARLADTGPRGIRTRRGGG